MISGPHTLIEIDSLPATGSRLFDRWQHVPVADWRWPNFSPKEMACKHCGGLLLVPWFMEELHQLRDAYSKPMIINSGYRCPDHNAEASRKNTGRMGPHTLGVAVDVSVRDADAYELDQLAKNRGFTGIGVCQREDMPRYLHLDMAPADRFPRPRVWSY